MPTHAQESVRQPLPLLAMVLARSAEGAVCVERADVFQVRQWRGQSAVGARSRRQGVIAPASVTAERRASATAAPEQQKNANVAAKKLMKRLTARLEPGVGMRKWRGTGAAVFHGGAITAALTPQYAVSEPAERRCVEGAR